MAIEGDSGSRRDTIAMAITAELQRQSPNSDVDVEALAEAVDLAIEGPTSTDEGKRPEDLNATNDD